MSMTGLGATPRGPAFVPPIASPGASETGGSSSRRWPLIAAGGLALMVAAGAGGAAGYVSGDTGAPTYAAAPADLVAAASRALPGVVSVQIRTGSGGASGSGFV